MYDGYAQEIAIQLGRIADAQAVMAEAKVSMAKSLEKLANTTPIVHEPPEQLKVAWLKFKDPAQVAEENKAL